MTEGLLVCDELQKRLGYKFSNLHLLQQSLTHASARLQNSNTYERLEFLGDRVLGLVIAEYLLIRFPLEREGDIARRHTQLVRREALFRVASRLNLGGYLIISAGEEDSGFRNNPGILSDVLEAIIAAIYVDGGFEKARSFILDNWKCLAEMDDKPPVDPKTALQELVQNRRLPLPIYRIVSQDGPPHAPQFTVSVTVAAHPSRFGKGGSKRRAEQSAAELMLQDIKYI